MDDSLCAVRRKEAVTKWSNGNHQTLGEVKTKLAEIERRAAQLLMAIWGKQNGMLQRAPQGTNSESYAG